ncbi:MAG: sialidase family protein [Planctomycetota bacterium]|nr:sialidase family protein [Planctomycetota bacterium]
MKIINRTMVYAAPERGMSAYEVSYYTRLDGLEKVRMRLLDISDDVPGPRELAFSKDNGRTWPEVVPVPQPREVEGGTLRNWPCCFFVDPVNGKLVELALEGLFPTNSSHWGAKSYYLKYSVSLDGGRTHAVDEEVIMPGYTHEHPMPGMWIGRNAFTNAAFPSMLRMPDGKLLAVISKTVHGPDGEFYNPGKGWFWTEIQVLHGIWKDDGRIEWHAGPIIALPPELACRGICEPALAMLPDGTVFTSMRACNGGHLDPESKLPGRKWQSISRDGGATFSFPKPWCYDDGQPFYSPDSISHFLRLASGRLLWIGNIMETNPVHGGPREQLYIVDVDEKTMRLVKSSRFLVADRKPEDQPTQLSNFSIHEDRETGDLVLYLPWFVLQEKDKWGADTWLYRIKVD